MERALGPVGAGILLDVVDFFSLGPTGIIFGLVIGSAIGWYMTGIMNVPRRWRAPLSWLAGVYCVIPGTQVIPLGTLAGALGRFFEKK